MSASSTDNFRWWFLPSWLGLDAPCVVTTWCLAVATSASLPVSSTALAALFLTVWAIYLTDRLIDVARCQHWRNVSGRMAFGRQFRWMFFTCLAICSAALVAVLLMGLTSEVVLRGLLVAGGMGIYFALFVAPMFFRGKLPGKEFGVGIFFALGCFAVLGIDGHSAPMLLGVASLVAYNCLVIAARDRDVDRATDPSGASTWWRRIDRDLSIIGSILCVASLLAIPLGVEWEFSVSLSAAFGLLVLLHRNAASWSGDVVRALADFSLLTPWPLIVFQNLSA